MLVTLGSNSSIASGASQTYQYACNSAQKVYLRCNDDGTDADDIHITVQIGNDVIVNDIAITALALISCINSGGGAYANTDTYACIDLGSHVLEPLENLYVTVRASAAVTAVDVSAVVNEGGVYAPLKLTNYSDTVFTDSNTLAVYAWCGASSALDNDTTAFTIRNQSYSATPQVQSGTSVSRTMTTDANVANRISVLGQNQVPLDTSVNHSSSDIDGVVCISAMTKLPSKAQSSKRSGQAVLRSMTSSERKAL